MHHNASSIFIYFHFTAVQTVQKQAEASTACLCFMGGQLTIEEGCFLRDCQTGISACDQASRSQTRLAHLHPVNAVECSKIELLYIENRCEYNKLTITCTVLESSLIELIQINSNYIG